MQRSGRAGRGAAGLATLTGRLKRTYPWVAHPKYEVVR